MSIISFTNDDFHNSSLEANLERFEDPNFFAPIVLETYPIKLNLTSGNMSVVKHSKILISTPLKNSLKDYSKDKNLNECQDRSFTNLREKAQRVYKRTVYYYKYHVLPTLCLGSAGVLSTVFFVPGARATSFPQVKAFQECYVAEGSNIRIKGIPTDVIKNSIASSPLNVEQARTSITSPLERLNSDPSSTINGEQEIQIASSPLNVEQDRNFITSPLDQLESVPSSIVKGEQKISVASSSNLSERPLSLSSQLNNTPEESRFSFFSLSKAKMVKVFFKTFTINSSNLRNKSQSTKTFSIARDIYNSTKKVFRKKSDQTKIFGVNQLPVCFPPGTIGMNGELVNVAAFNPQRPLRRLARSGPSQTRRLGTPVAGAGRNNSDPSLLRALPSTDIQSLLTTTNNIHIISQPASTSCCCLCPAYPIETFASIEMDTTSDKDYYIASMDFNRSYEVFKRMSRRERTDLNRRLVEAQASRSYFTLLKIFKELVECDSELAGSYVSIMIEKQTNLTPSNVHTEESIPIIPHMTAHSYGATDKLYTLCERVFGQFYKNLPPIEKDHWKPKVAQFLHYNHQPTRGRWKPMHVVMTEQQHKTCSILKNDYGKTPRGLNESTLTKIQGAWNDAFVNWVSQEPALDFFLPEYLETRHEERVRDLTTAKETELFKYAGVPLDYVYEFGAVMRCNYYANRFCEQAVSHTRGMVLGDTLVEKWATTKERGSMCSAILYHLSKLFPADSLARKMAFQDAIRIEAHLNSFGTQVQVRSRTGDQYANTSFAAITYTVENQPSLDTAHGIIKLMRRHNFLKNGLKAEDSTLDHLIRMLRKDNKYL